MSTRRPIVGGNWKMNTDRESAAGLARQVAADLVRDGALSSVDVAVFPPFPYLVEVGQALRGAGAAILLGAQDFYFEKNGAFTGEVSLEMLADCGVSIVLVGHSERRHVIGETDQLLNRKVLAALGATNKANAAGFTCVLCVGETLAQREAGETNTVNERQIRAGLKGVSPEQMSRVVIAYEPVWAIGTGRTATPADAREAHANIRRVLADMFGDAIGDRTRVQYGGSVNASNASGLFAQPGVDGGLIGGASLKAAEFGAIVRGAMGR
ncbi:MAG: triose-phosphate isomerase [Phycisphaerales bacterium]